MKILIIILILSSTLLFSIDHQDGNALNNPAADITGVYAWLQNKNQINLIMNVHPNATTSSRFSDQVSYVFHISSSEGYGKTQSRKRLVCQFDSTQKVSCLVEQDTLISNVDASNTQGTTSDDGRFRIFTGLRNDPTYYDSQNFELARTYIRDASGGFTLDSAGCPDVDTTTSSTAINTITGSIGGVVGTNIPGVDSYLNSNVLSIVIQVSPSLIGAGPYYSVWGSTNDR